VKFGIEHSLKSVKELHLIYSVKESQILIQSDKNIWYFTWKPQQILFAGGDIDSLSTRCLRVACIRLLGQPIRYKHKANAPQYYVVRLLPLLLGII